MSKYIKLKKSIEYSALAYGDGNTFVNSNTTRDETGHAVCDLMQIDDNYIGRIYGNRHLLYTKKEVNSVPSPAWYVNHDFIMGNIFKKYRYKWDELKKTTEYSYNPLWNVDGTETTTTIHGERQNSTSYDRDNTTNTFGEDTTTEINGARVKSNEYAQATHTQQNGATLTTNTFGETTETTNHGATEKTNELDEVKTTTVNGLRKTTTTDKVNPYNVDETATQKAQTLVIVDESTDTETTAPRTDKESVKAFTDSTTNAPHTDTVGTATSTDILTDGAHTDTIRDAESTDTTTRGTHTDTVTRDARTDAFTEFEHTDTTTIIRSGNIGVTKTTELINSQRETVNFLLLDIMLQDILSEITFY